MGTESSCGWGHHLWHLIISAFSIPVVFGAKFCIYLRVPCVYSVDVPQPNADVPVLLESMGLYSVGHGAGLHVHSLFSRFTPCTCAFTRCLSSGLDANCMHCQELVQRWSSLPQHSALPACHNEFATRGSVHGMGAVAVNARFPVHAACQVFVFYSSVINNLYAKRGQEWPAYLRPEHCNVVVVVCMQHFACIVCFKTGLGPHLH